MTKFYKDYGKKNNNKRSLKRERRERKEAKIKKVRSEVQSAIKEEERDRESKCCEEIISKGEVLQELRVKIRKT